MANEGLVQEQARRIHRTIQKLQRQIIGQQGVLKSPASGEACMDFTLPQIHMLMAVRAHQPMTIKTLARKLAVSAPSASTMVERLVETGALERQQSQVDRREVLITLTSAAEGTLQTIENQILSGVMVLLERVGPEYAQQWCKVYDRVNEILEEEEAAHAVATQEQGAL